MTDRFVSVACREHGRHIHSITPDFYERLEKQDWPGNVRELRNVVESSVVMVTGTTLTAAAVRLDERKVFGKELNFPEGITLEQFEKEALTQMLRRYDGNRTLVADKLGLARRTIQRKIKEYNLPF